MWLSWSDGPILTTSEHQSFDDESLDCLVKSIYYREVRTLSYERTFAGNLTLCVVFVHWQRR